MKKLTLIEGLTTSLDSIDFRRIDILDEVRRDLKELIDLSASYLEDLNEDDSNDSFISERLDSCSCDIHDELQFLESLVSQALDSWDSYNTELLDLDDYVHDEDEGKEEDENE